MLVLCRPSRRGFAALLALLFALLLVLRGAPATAAPITFDTLGDLASVTTQFPGMTFTNAVTLRAGYSLNEFEFPPHSGDTVVSDDGAGIGIVFGAPVQNFSAWFTYGAPLVITAFDAGGAQLAQLSSLFASNLALSGDAGSHPNELFDLSDARGIARLFIVASPGGGSFVMDDVDVGVAAAALPEPASLCLFFAGLLVLRQRCRRRGAALPAAGATQASAVGATQPSAAGMAKPAAAGALLLALAGPALAGPQVGLTEPVPSIVTAGLPTRVTVTARIDDPNVIPASVVLQRIEANGDLTTIGNLRDDGIDADAALGDNIYTFAFTLSEPAPVALRYRVSAAFRGVLRRAASEPFSLTVRAATSADQMLAQLAAAIAANDVNAALVFFSSAPSNRAALESLDPPTRSALAQAFATARLVSSVGDTRTYQLAWHDDSGAALTLRVGLAQTPAGDWHVMFW